MILALTGNSFVAALLCVFAAGALGQLLCFKYICERHPEIPRKYFLLVLFHPSLAMWSGMLLKDSLGICALGLIIYNTDKLLERFSLGRFCGVICGLYTAYGYRSFILLLAAILFLFAFYDRKLAPNASRDTDSLGYGRLLYIYLSGMAAIAFIFVYASKSGAEMIEVQRETNMVYIQMEAGSSFKNAELGYSMEGVAALGIGVVNSTLRPFIWEVRKIVQFAAALENVCVLIFVCHGLQILMVRLDRARRRRIGASIIGCLCVAIVCAAGVGLFASNLGTISRYRIPMIPFWIMGPSLAIGTYSLQRRAHANLHTLSGPRRPKRLIGGPASL
jgi:hypothetical protein